MANINSKKLFTSSQLVKTIRRRAMIPNDTSAFEDDDLLEIANEELRVEILPKLLSINEEYLVDYVDIPLVNGKTEYEIPYRAVANKLREVSLINESGGISEVARINLEHLSDYTNWSLHVDDNILYIQNDKIVFVDTTAVGDNRFVRMYYYRSPSVLVKENEVGRITFIDKASGTIRIDEFPDKFSLQPLFDFISSKVPNKFFKYDIKSKSVNSNTNEVFFNPDDIPASLQVGDFLCESQETIIPLIPVEMHPILAQSVAVHVLESLGDEQGLNLAKARLDRMTENVLGMAKSRIEGSPQKIKARHSTLSDSIRKGSYRRRMR